MQLSQERPRPAGTDGHPMSTSFDIRMKVAFHDLDPLQVVWHGNYLKYFDVARFGLFAARGIDLYAYMIEKKFAFPVTRTSVKHIVPLRAFDDFICQATVTEAQYKIGMAFAIRKADDGTLCARGTSEQLAVRYPEMEMEFGIPDDIRQALGF
jgi:acyl-CoA thioester hydrolase